MTDMENRNNSLEGGVAAAAPCSQKRATPETDSVWADKSKNILEHARRMERERDAAIARESAILEFMEVEMGWEYFRAEYNIGDSPSQSLQNAKKVKAFLSANTEGQTASTENDHGN